MPYPLASPGEDENDSALSHLSVLQRPRARTMIDSRPGRMADHSAIQGGSLYPLPKGSSSRSPPPQMRLQLSIPPLLSKSGSITAGSTPQSESPETPASVTSPIAGVVDLTKYVATTSKEAVAHGGLSDIYLGEWHRTEESWVAGEKEVVRKLNREVYVWHRLEHPNVVKLFGTSYHMSGRPAMVMQWYDNGNAVDYLRKNPTADRLQLVLDVACGLAYLHTHRHPIIHADLKGNNVLITDEGRAAICDFGLSKVLEDLGCPSGFSLSNPGIGPLRWLAPELMEDDEQPAIPASDVWSFGCTAFELLTGLMPYPHCLHDPKVVLEVQNRVKPSGPDMHEQFVKLDIRVRSLLESCWSFTPAERPVMKDIQECLQDILSNA
ncbi:hypothetical protein CVT26_010154 [Gymnopilus dilepis]|uniref:Protein kinase domain-containing protein n=1 Tax=Gymnopilus dilepis TaxID=231916 RepID=A0A409YS07_9AGAR|nr:hypothetical protein CVT26_010154 [Gymnopilus dilepis]